LQSISWPSQEEARKRLHGENHAESFGIFEAESNGAGSFAIRQSKTGF